MQISVLTYNLLFHQGSNDLRTILDLHSPDILCFQEAENKADFESFLEKGGYKLAKSAPSFHKHKKNYHISIFYKPKKIKLDYSEFFSLPKSIYEKFLSLIRRKYFPRSFITSTFTAGNNKLSVINCHLSPLATDIERVRQLKKIFKDSEKIQHPLIILGDFNYPYGRRRLENIIRTYNLKEATTNIDYTRETKLLRFIPIRLKLDYILYRQLKSAKVKKLENYSSDHLPLIANFSL